MSTNGKGSKARPLSVSRKEYEEAWERTFGKPPTWKPTNEVEPGDGFVFDWRLQQTVGVVKP